MAIRDVMYHSSALTVAASPPIIAVNENMKREQAVQSNIPYKPVAKSVWCIKKVGRDDLCGLLRNTWVIRTGSFTFSVFL
jgi:hypothetical protein